MHGFFHLRPTLFDARRLNMNKTKIYNLSRAACWAHVYLQAPVLLRRVFVPTGPICAQRRLVAVLLAPVIPSAIRVQSFRRFGQTGKPTRHLPPDLRVLARGLRLDLPAHEANETANVLVVVAVLRELPQHLSVLRQSDRGDLIPLDGRDCAEIHVEPNRVVIAARPPERRSVVADHMSFERSVCFSVPKTTLERARHVWQGNAGLEILPRSAGVLGMSGQSRPAAQGPSQLLTHRSLAVLLGRKSFVLQRLHVEKAGVHVLI